LAQKEHSLSIKRVGLISVYLVLSLVFIFAMLIVHQEYTDYNKEVAKLQQNIDSGDAQAVAVLEQKKEEFRVKKMRYVIGIGGVALFMFITIYLIIRTISFLVEYEFAMFVSEFGEAAKNHKRIDEEKFNFLESKSIVKDANNMIGEIQEREMQLVELNKDLENRVRQKTLKLQELVQAQDTFIKKSIHEINTPLSIILTNIDLLKMQGIANKNLTSIESGSKLIHNLFNDLSYLVKKDRIEYKKMQINISAFLKERLSFFAELANVNGLQIVTNIEDGLHIWMNETKLQRVIDNNLSNIIKYSYHDSAVFITLKKEDGTIVLKFKNYSDTIDAVDKVFEEYYREDSVKGGYGIGLSIVKDICDENGIIIALNSENMITEFTYTFPNTIKGADEDTFA